MIEGVLVAAIVGLALLVLARRAWRALRGRGGCGCGAPGGCPAARGLAERIGRLEERTAGGNRR